MSNPTNGKTISVELSTDDLANIVAIGNRANMSGLEADTWVELKNRLRLAAQPKPEPEPDLDLEGFGSPGGTA